MRTIERHPVYLFRGAELQRLVKGKNTYFQPASELEELFLEVKEALDKLSVGGVRPSQLDWRYRRLLLDILKTQEAQDKAVKERGMAVLKEVLAEVVRQIIEKRNLHEQEVEFLKEVLLLIESLFEERISKREKE